MDAGFFVQPSNDIEEPIRAADEARTRIGFLTCAAQGRRKVVVLGSVEHQI
jgi:hypothetical protein